MKKKVMSLFLAIAMLLSLMPTVLAAETCLKADKNTLHAGEDISITYTIPNTVDGVADISIKISFDNTKLKVKSVTPATIPNATSMHSNPSEANAAGAFSATFNEPTGDPIGTVNAGTALLTAVLTANEDITSGELRFSVQVASIADVAGESLATKAGFDTTELKVTVPKPPITSVTATVATPVKGAALDTVGTVASGAPYTVTKVEWFEGANASGTAVTGNAKAKQIYTAQLTVTAKDGESFAASLNGTTTVDGYTVARKSNILLTLTKTFDATVDKDTPTITTRPTASTITYGQTLNASALTGGKASVAGTFKWKNAAIAPQVSDSGTTEYEVIFTPDDTANYTEVTCKVKLTVTPKAINDVAVKDIADQTYTGSQIKPAVTVTGDNGKVLVLSKDYTVEYGENEDVGTGTVTVKAKDGGNYTFADVVKNFKINKVTVPAGVQTELKAAVTFFNAEYDGAAHDAVTVGTLPTGWTLIGYSTDGTSYSDTVPQVKDVADGTTVYVKFTNSNYSDYVVSGKAAVIAKSLISSMIELGTQATYDGSAHGVVYTVKDGETTLTLGTDYTVQTSEVTNVGDNTLVVTGKGNYSGEASAKWSLQKAAPTVSDFTVTAPDAAGYTYTGSPISAVTPTTSKIGMGKVTVKYGDSTTAPTNVGSYTVTFDVAEGQNYKAASGLSIGTLKINQAALTGTDKEVSIRYTDAAVKTFSPKDFGFTQPGTLAVGTKTDGSNVLATDYPKADNGNVQVKLANGLTKSAVDSKATIELIFTPTGAANYKTAAVKLTITVTDKAAQAPLVLTGGTTVVYGQTLTLSTTGGSGDGAVTYAVTEGTGKATISGNVLTATQAGTVTVKATKAATDEYSAVESAPVTITIAKAKPDGTPSYTAITADGKTLADAALGVGTITPAGTIKWVDENGAELAATTSVEAGKNYMWKFVPEDTTNYEELTGSVQLWHKSTNGKPHRPSSGGSSKITISAVLTAEDARSATDYTSGIYGLTFRSNADFSGFQGIKVDGKTVNKENYIAENNGGIEIYLKAAYLKTLADGKYTLTIMTTSGDASIDFTIGGVTTSPKTFDTGIAMYVAMAAVSVTGMAWLGKKKEN